VSGHPDYQNKNASQQYIAYWPKFMEQSRPYSMYTTRQKHANAHNFSTAIIQANLLSRILS